MIKFAQAYAACLFCFLILDYIWINIVAQNFYMKHLSDLLRLKNGEMDANLPAAAVFYLMFLFGVVYFVSLPAATAGSLSIALINGALFGLITYATFDLTCHALFKSFPLIVVLVDLAWGTFISTVVGLVGFWVMR
jgi:uncharacterized membrane protein